MTDHPDPATVAHSSLSPRGHWLVMMTRLLLLRSRLLLPVAAVEHAEARQEIDSLRQQLVLREQLEQAALWLERRPRLGCDVFARGAPELRPMLRHSGPAAFARCQPDRAHPVRTLS